MQINDNDGGPAGIAPQPPDPHGHAALLLIESLIHGLLDRAALSIDEAIDIVDIANDVQAEIAEAAGDPGGPMWRSHALLSAIGQSLLTIRETGLQPTG